MKTKAIIVTTILFLALIMSGCTDIQEKEVINNSTETTAKEEIPDYSIIEMEYTNGDNYDCKLYCPEELEIRIVPKGNIFNIAIKNDGSRDIYVKKVKGQIEERRDLNEVRVDRTISPNEEIIISLNAGDSSGWSFLKIYELYIITDEPPNK